MAIHSSILDWRMPWTKEPGGLQFMVLQRVRQDWATNIFTFNIVYIKKKKKNLPEHFLLSVDYPRPHYLKKKKDKKYKVNTPISIRIPCLNAIPTLC